MSDFLINPARLTFHVPDLLAGLLLRGNRGDSRNSAGNGDCLLFDGASGIIGVADGTERSPQAARRFLKGLAEQLATSGLSGGRQGPDDILDAARQVLEHFLYDDRTTFLCVFGLSDQRVFYLSGGDSLLVHLDAEEGRILFRNRPNMGFAGRCRQVMECGSLEVAGSDLLLLATDGLWDLQGDAIEDVFRSIPALLRSGPLKSLPGRLLGERHPACSSQSLKPHDDLGLVLMRPSWTGWPGCGVLLGGTDDQTERFYQDRVKRRDLPDSDLVLPAEARPFWVLPDAFDDLLSGAARNRRSGQEEGRAGARR